MAKSPIQIYRETVCAFVNTHPEDAPCWKIPFRVFELAYLEAGYRRKTAFDALCEITKAKDVEFDNHFVYIK